MADVNKIIEMVSRGYAQNIVASACGVSDSYISQLLSDPEVREQVSAKRLETLGNRAATDDSVDSLETKALDRLHQLMPMITDPMKALRVYQVANGAKRKTHEPEQAGDKHGTIVNITLPEVAEVHFKLSSRQQVVEVDGRSTATLPSNVLTKRLEDRREQQKSAQITDSSGAKELLSRIEQGVPGMQVRNIFQGTQQ
jgi:predicted transcriptional regulator